METIPEIRISEHPATTDDRHRILPWVNKLVSDTVSSQVGCMVLLAFVLGGFGTFAINQWWSDAFRLGFASILTVVLVVVLIALAKKLKAERFDRDSFTGHLLRVEVTPQEWWPISADDTRAADVLVQIAPGFVFYGHMSTPRSRTPDTIGDFPGQRLRYEYFVIDTAPKRYLRGDAILMRVVAEGAPPAPGNELQWSEVSMRAYDIGVYEERGEGVGNYPWPTMIELLADLTSAGMTAGLRVIDDRPKKPQRD